MIFPRTKIYMTFNGLWLKRVTSSMSVRNRILILRCRSQMADFEVVTSQHSPSQEVHSRRTVLELFAHACPDNDTSHCQRATKGFFSNQWCSNMLESRGRSVG